MKLPPSAHLPTSLPSLLGPLILITDPYGTVVDVNEAFLKEFGIGRRQLLGRSLASLVYTDMPASLMNKMEVAITTGESWRGIVRFQTKEGCDYWADVTSLPLLKDGQVIRNCVVLLPPDVAVKRRAETLYRNPNTRCPQGFKSASLSRTWLALGSLPYCALALLALLQANWLQALITLTVALPSLLLGWRGLKHLRQLSEQEQQTTSDQLTCYLYTGGLDESCILQHAMEHSRAEARALTAYMIHTSNAVNQTKNCRDHFIARINDAIRHQGKDARAIDQAMRTILEDQHLVTTAVTQIQQLAFNVQNMSEQGRGQLKRLSQATRRQLLKLEQSHPELKNIASQIGSVKGLIEKIDAATEKSLCILQPGTRSDDADIFVAIQQVQQSAESMRLAVAKLHLFFHNLTSASQAALALVEAGIQASSQTLALTGDIDYSLQASISLVNRINRLAVDVGDAMHHQSVTRATANHHLQALQENLANAIEAQRNIGCQNEKLDRELAGI